MMAQLFDEMANPTLYQVDEHDTEESSVESELHQSRQEKALLLSGPQRASGTSGP